MTSISKSEFKNRIRNLDPYHFESLVAEIWEAYGWETTQTNQSRDKGIDIRLSRQDPVLQKQLIQAKRYGSNNLVGSSEIRRYETLKRQEPDVDSVVIVTSSHFTNAAEGLANDLNVKLVDIDDLYEISIESDVVGNSDLEIIDQHNQKDHNYEIYECPLCGEELTKDPRDLQTHYGEGSACEIDISDDRPSEISVSDWWDIKQALK